MNRGLQFYKYIVYCGTKNQNMKFYDVTPKSKLTDWATKKHFNFFDFSALTATLMVRMVPPVLPRSFTALKNIKGRTKFLILDEVAKCRRKNRKKNE